MNKRHNNFYLAKGKFFIKLDKGTSRKAKEKRPLRSHTGQWSKRPNGKEENKLEKKKKTTVKGTILPGQIQNFVNKDKKNSKNYANKVDYKFRVGSRAPDPALNLLGSLSCSNMI